LGREAHEAIRASRAATIIRAMSSDLACLIFLPAIFLPSSAVNHWNGKKMAGKKIMRRWRDFAG
jgi:hypothetical protein